MQKCPAASTKSTSPMPRQTLHEHFIASFQSIECYDSTWIQEYDTFRQTYAPVPEVAITLTKFKELVERAALQPQQWEVEIEFDRRGKPKWKEFNAKVCGREAGSESEGELRGDWKEVVLRGR